MIAIYYKMYVFPNLHVVNKQYTYIATYINTLSTGEVA